jgi:hypothetical protein
VGVLSDFSAPAVGAVQAEFVDGLLRKRGFAVRPHKGSLSWLPNESIAGGETAAKLLYRGRGRYIFGLREEECRKHGLDQKDHWYVFGVRPKINPTFYGVPVYNDRKSRQMLERIFASIPEMLADRRRRGPEDFGSGQVHAAVLKSFWAFQSATFSRMLSLRSVTELYF